MPRTSPQPRMITISSMGLTPHSHAAMPLPMRVLYGAMLDVPHRDKVGAERIIAHCTGWAWDKIADREPPEEIMGPGDWTQRPGLPAPGTLNSVLVIRPALLTDGDCRADKAKARGKPAYRVSEPDISTWTVSRKDVAHFVADAVLNRWHEFENKRVTIGY
ncbi:hypothetical protein BD779DRAFT_1558843 [Infundibulicybe gibba]|nr:hypothetical protein BD779DRAFT_1558843 [Infundibulicybe gibba]